MVKLIAILLGGLIYVGITIAASLLGMIYGWGIEPQNWWWISLSYVLLIVGLVFNAMIQSALKAA